MVDHKARYLFFLLIFFFKIVQKLFKIIFKIYFLARGRGRENEKERHIIWLPLAHPHTCPQFRSWPPTQACALTGNPTGFLSVHRLVPSPLSHTNQGQRAVLTSVIPHKETKGVLGKIV